MSTPDHHGPTWSHPLDDPRAVAAFRLPIPVERITLLSKTCKAFYGPDLVLEQRGRFWVVLLPEPDQELPPRREPGHSHDVDTPCVPEQCTGHPRWQEIRAAAAAPRPHTRSEDTDDCAVCGTTLGAAGAGRPYDSPDTCPGPP